MTPNILYLHSHDTGRYVQPYGHSVPTPNIQRLADQGLLFRQAFCAAPTCSGSRACLLTGQWAHSNGMIGLAHRGFELNDYSHHLVKTLRDAGYWTGLVGEQHLSRDPDVLGYDHVVDIDNHHVDAVAPAALRLIAERPPEPFFLSIGFFETHREYFEPTSVRDSLYSLPPANLPDTRRDAPRHGLLQGQRALARPRRRRGAERARRARPRRRHDRDPHHRPRARLPGRQGDADRPRPRRDADRARPRRLPRRQGLRGARLADRHLPDAVRAGGHPGARRGCRAARCCRWCGARPTRSTTRSSPS